MKHSLRFTALVIILAAASILPAVHAAKPRLRKSRAPAVRGVAYSSARLSRATNSVVISFLNLASVSSVTYTLSYAAGGTSQGVVGTLVPTGQSGDSRDLYFGTCSKGVCTPHYSPKNVILLIETTLKSGGVHTKRYRIRV